MVRNLISLATDAASEQVQLGATNSVLDRAIGRPTQTVELGAADRPYEEIFDGLAGGSRAESRRARGLDVSAGTEGIESLGLPDEPEADVPPASAFAADEAGWSRLNARGQALTREQQRPTPHAVQGEEALRIAAELARQQAIEAPHRRYRRR